MTKLKWWDLSVRDQILVPSLPFPQWFTKWIMCPFCWSDQLFALLPPWKKENYVFATDLAKWNSSHYPPLGLKLLSLKVPSHCALLPVSAGEILNSLCTKLFKFCIILKLGFFEIGTHWPHWLWELAAVWAGGVLIFKFLSLPNAPFLVRFPWGLLGAHPAA